MALNPNTKMQLLGNVTIFTSALFIYLSTVTIRWAERAVTIDSAYFVFARFILGFAVICGVMAVRGKKPRVHSYHLLIGRALTNCVAVYCFYKAVAMTTVAEANILNMTYPLFVAAFTWVAMKQQRDLAASLTVLVAFIGVWLVLAPDFASFKTGNLWGVASGSTAAAAIIYLNVSRQYHDTDTILFFMFGLGVALVYLVFRKQIFLPGPTPLFYLLMCGGFGVVGQYLLTLGFRYVTAVEGSIVSSARILMAALLGPFIAADPPLTVTGWVGALMIFGANVYLALRRVTPQ